MTRDPDITRHHVSAPPKGSMQPRRPAPPSSSSAPTRSAAYANIPPSCRTRPSTDEATRPSSAPACPGQITGDHSFPKFRVGCKRRKFVTIPDEHLHIGVLHPAPGTGVPGGDNAATERVSILFGTANAVIEFAGALPGSAGMNRIQARIPAAAVRIPRIEPGPSQYTNAAAPFTSLPSDSIAVKRAVPASLLLDCHASGAPRASQPTWTHDDAASRTSTERWSSNNWLRVGIAGSAKCR